jgi:hypothetical protein
MWRIVKNTIKPIKKSTLLNLKLGEMPIKNELKLTEKGTMRITNNIL